MMHSVTSSTSSGKAAVAPGQSASLFISAAHKSSGKTTLAIGLCAALRAQGLWVQPFKKGPDYIDPLWLSAASGHPCHNLDFNTMTAAEIQQMLEQVGAQADCRLIEANKGLYDGVALDGADSNAALAKLTTSTVLLVLDTRGMTRGIAPLLLGYQHFDPAVNIGGVILNRTGGARHVAKLRRAVEEYTDIPVWGAVRECTEMVIEARHLGLMPSNESTVAERQITQIRDLVTQQVDMAGILALVRGGETLAATHSVTQRLGTADKRNTAVGYRRVSNTAPRLHGGTDKRTSVVASAVDVSASLPLAQGQSVLERQTPLRIAICQDPAFAFYYPDDLSAMRRAGAELVPVNTLNDAALPAVDGLFIGGGFPETQMHQLAANTALRRAIYAAIEAGMPTYAECGGLMYLARSLHWRGEQAAMVGIIPGDAVMHAKPQGRGYVKLQETAEMPWPGKRDPADLTTMIHAHEFHYSALENLPAGGRFAYRMQRGQGIDGQHDGWVYKNLLASYTHMRHTGQFPWAQRFIEFVRLKRLERVAAPSPD